MGQKSGKGGERKAPRNTEEIKLRGCGTDEQEE
jgi:hypothetical protein